jgi:hypothetical protein
MRVTYLDATEHPGTVQEYKIMSARGIVINGELAYTGSVSDTVQPRLDVTGEFSPTAKGASDEIAFAAHGERPVAHSYVA